jgi:hypothetical protein
VDLPEPELTLDALSELILPDSLARSIEHPPRA